MNTQSMQKIFDTATCLYSPEDVQAALDKMAENINQHPLAQDTPIFLGVAIGGLLPLSHLVTRLKFPLEIDFAHVSSYQHNTYASELSWLTKPQLALKDRTVVIVDDILDKGITLSTLIDYCRKSGAKAVYTAVLLDKKVQRSPNGLSTADFTGIEIPDRFVFGFGLDYKGFWRNAPGIFEVADAYK